jgi:hypothetical protein
LTHLIELNDNGTLIPTVSNDGFVSYSEDQIERYLNPFKTEETTLNEAKLESQEPLLGESWAS